MSGFDWNVTRDNDSQNATQNDSSAEKPNEIDLFEDVDMPEVLRDALRQYAANGHKIIVAEPKPSSEPARTNTAVYETPTQRALQASIKGPRTESGTKVWADLKLPFEQCPAGMSFQIAKNIPDHNLRVMISRQAKKLCRKYSVISHKDSYEIYRRE